MSNWVLQTTEQGYLLQFTHRPAPFRSIVQTSVQDHDSYILWSEVQSLLAKGAMETVPLANSESGFYSHYVLVPKKDTIFFLKTAVWPS